MKKLLIGTLFCLQVIGLHASDQHLNKFRDAITKAADAPFITLPYYGFIANSYFNKKPNAPAIFNWKNQQAPAEYQSNNSARSNAFILFAAKEKLNIRHTPTRVGIDTALSATGAGLFSFLMQYAFKKYGENSASISDINLLNVAVFAGLGAFWSLNAHASLYKMSEQAQEIARTKNK